MVREEELVLHQPQGARLRIGEQARTYHPPGEGQARLGVREGEAHQQYQQQGRPRYQRLQPISDGTNQAGWSRVTAS